jgi:hypothetical protein
MSPSAITRTLSEFQQSCFRTKGNGALHAACFSLIRETHMNTVRVVYVTSKASCQKQWTAQQTASAMYNCIIFSLVHGGRMYAKRT